MYMADWNFQSIPLLASTNGTTTTEPKGTTTEPKGTTTELRETTIVATSATTVGTVYMAFF